MSQDTQPIRSGEELNEAHLREFLHANFPENKGEIELSQFPAGSSNLTYCVKIGVAEYVLRRPPFGNTVKSAHDMKREFKVLSRLSKVYAPAPEPLVLCEDESIIGAEFYLMERRRGYLLRKTLPDGTREISAENARKICAGFIENLAVLHLLDYEKIGLGDFGKPVGFARRQVEGWTRRYSNAKTDDWRELEEAIIWLNTNIPPHENAALVHNDYKFDNVMLNPQNLTEIVAVLDWEMATVGEPLMDFGTTLGYWIERDAAPELLDAGFNPSFLMTRVSRAELVEMYAAKTAFDVSNIHFYYVFGVFKIAVIIQQIYARFAKGLTRDERFAKYDSFVRTLGEIAADAIAKGKM